MPKLLVLSRGIRALPNNRCFVPEFDNWVFSEKSDFDAVAGWGNRPTARRAREIAKKKNIPYIALEDGFLRSIQLGRDGAPALSLVVDPIGIYYDASRPSQLEQWLESGTYSNGEFLMRAQSVRQRLLEERLSKYNNAPDKQLWANDSLDRVLVIDQTFGDMSVSGALATEKSFQEMLEAALDENPASEIVVRTHPDVVAGHRQGYIKNVANHPRIILSTETIHPWSVLDCVSKVYTVSSLLGFEALLAGKQVRCFGMPFYAGWGLTDDELHCPRRTRKCTLDEVFAAAYMKYARYIDPIKGEACEIDRVITLLSDRRRHWLQTSGSIFCSGVSPWKRKFLPDFLGQGKKSVRFVKKPQHAIKKASECRGRWALWASAETEELRTLSQKRKVPTLRIEDAFLRSVGLGSDLTRPGSLALDNEGIYYDAAHPSRLETLLRETSFTDNLLQRAAALREAILAAGLTKYNVGTHVKLNFKQNDRRLILVPGQVEDDASILRGSPEITTNLDLLRAVRQNSPDAYIIYKPHPDVMVGNRRGNIDTKKALELCDHIVTDISMDQLLSVVDEVHTMTSLTGFEALLRAKHVSCYGLPFYAGWGLTEDRLTCKRRGRVLSIDQLVAATLILYPTYVDPITKQICSVEDYLNWLSQNKSNVQGAPWKTRVIRAYQNWRQGRD